MCQRRRQSSSAICASPLDDTTPRRMTGVTLYGILSPENPPVASERREKDDSFIDCVDLTKIQWQYLALTVLHEPCSLYIGSQNAAENHFASLSSEILCLSKCRERKRTPPFSSNWCPLPAETAVGIYRNGYDLYGNGLDGLFLQSRRSLPSGLVLSIWG